MNALREYMRNNPLVGWAVASVLALVAAYMLFTRLTAKTETKELTELVTIRATDTGETWQMPRGAMEKRLYERPYPVNPNDGLPSPTTGKLTGFPVDAWKETVDRINAEREAAGQGSKDKAAPPAAGK